MGGMAFIKYFPLSTELTSSHGKHCTIGSELWPIYGRMKCSYLCVCMRACVCARVSWAEEALGLGSWSWRLLDLVIGRYKSRALCYLLRESSGSHQRKQRNGGPEFWSSSDLFLMIVFYYCNIGVVEWMNEYRPKPRIGVVNVCYLYWR